MDNTMTLSEELTWRGFTNQTTYKDLAILDNSKISFYWGVDPSADSMTIGNLAAAMMVRAFIKHGHKPVLLVGGATGLIGDPDGKTEERQLKTPEEISANKAAIVRQYHQIFGGSELKIVDNYDWFQHLNYLDFLRDTGKHVPVRQMLGRDFVQSRLGEEGVGISYAEFSYVLIQAYDFLRLFEDEKVSLQLCGSDQWGNSIAGVDLIRRKTGKEAHVFSAPLIVDKSTGRKFGKTEVGAIWLDPTKTSPTQFYQFWINTDDQAVGDYLRVYTELDQQTFEQLISEHNQDPGKRLAQNRLAQEVTRIVHGDQAMEIARSVTDMLIGRVSLTAANQAAIDNLRQEIPSIKVSQSGSIIEALTATGLASSNTEARRLINDNAISINGQKEQRENFLASDFMDGRLLIRRGKAFKDSALIELG